MKEYRAYTEIWIFMEYRVLWRILSQRNEYPYELNVI